MRVEPGRDEDEPGVERAHARLHLLDEGGEILRVTGAGCERDVQRRGVARARPAAPRIERPLVQRDDEHRVVPAEDRLGAVAVMHVPVDDRHALDPERVLRVARGDRDRPEEAEPHRPARERVVPRWSREREATALGRLDGAACREQCRLPRRRPGDRVGSSHVSSSQARDQPDVRGVVHALDLRPVGRPCLARATERLEQDGESLLALGVTEPARRMEPAERRVRDQLDAASSSRPARRPSPSSSAALAAAAQSGSRSGSGGTGAEASSVAMWR